MSPTATSAASAPGCCSSRTKWTRTSTRASAGAARGGLQGEHLAEGSRAAARRSRRRSSTSARSRASGTSTRTRRSGARRSIRSAGRRARRRGGEGAPPRHPPGARGRASPPGLDAARLPAPGRRHGRDAGRVQGLRPRRRAVRPLRHADREDPRRRARHVVLPELPALRSEQVLEPPVAVEAPELGVAADRRGRRSGSAAPSSRPSVVQGGAEAGIVVELDLVVVEAARRRGASSRGRSSRTSASYTSESLPSRFTTQKTPE